MVVKVLNKLGLYTKRQYLFEFFRANNCEEEYETLDEMVEGLESERKRLLKAFRECEELRSEVVKENKELKREVEKLRLKVVRLTKRRKR